MTLNQYLCASKLPNIFSIYPSRHQLRRWRNANKRTGGAEDADDEFDGYQWALKHLPACASNVTEERGKFGGENKVFDAVDCLRQPKLAKFLRKAAEANETLNAAIDAACPDDGVRELVRGKQPARGQENNGLPQSP